MNTGQMTSKITYVSPSSTTVDDYGGAVVTDASAVTVRAKARQLSYNERLRYGLPLSVVAYQFKIWYSEGIKKGTEITFNSETYIVNEIENYNERKRETHFIASKK